jgi:transposase-like protein
MPKKNKGGKDPIHENSFKIAVARDYLTGDVGMIKVGRKYNLSDGQVRWMVKWYQREYGDQPLSGDLAEQKPKAENAADLSRALELANMKIAGLEMMIEIASKELGFDIRKKPGAKQ